MWADVWKRWLEICCWWLPTSKGEQTSGAAAKPSPTVADDVSTDVGATGEGSHENDTDDLTVIKGIGPSIQTKLSSFGITTLAALAASDPETLAVKLKASQPISATRVKGWIEEAQDRVAGRS
jgi:predicted flap endonuclease-1-like 5' DNA nuclease